MFKTIFVAPAGIASDTSAFETAFLVARLFGAHLSCLHVRPDWAQMATAVPAALGGGFISEEVFNALEEGRKILREQARKGFDTFLSRRKVPTASSPGLHGVSASWHEEEGDQAEKITTEGRFHDLIVLSRPHTEGLTIEETGAIILSGGRPVLLAPERAPENLAPTIAIAWKETPEAARAVTAAMPLIEKSEKVFVFSAGEDSTVESAGRLANELHWHGVRADAHHLARDGVSDPESVLDAAEGRGADLLVMGGYGHARMREWVFGGFTRHVLQTTRLPVFLFH